MVRIHPLRTQQKKRPVMIATAPTRVHHPRQSRWTVIQPRRLGARDLQTYLSLRRCNGGLWTHLRKRLPLPVSLKVKPRGGATLKTLRKDPYIAMASFWTNLKAMEVTLTSDVDPKMTLTKPTQTVLTLATTAISMMTLASTVEMKIQRKDGCSLKHRASDK